MRFSVMIPTYEPGDSLRSTLVSVLKQAPSETEMQIAVVDDQSPHADVDGIVSSVPGGERVEIHRGSRRLGLAGNWNHAISLARGELVHLLHQDDFVHPGFYAHADRAFHSNPAIGMAFCRSRIVDGAGRHVKTCSRQAWMSGVLSNWLPRIAERQRIQTPAAVVARHVYQEVGGYRSDLHQAVDWEMWVRIAAAYRVWYEPRVLATFRRHGDSESTRLLATGAVWADLARAIQINAQSLPRSIREDVMNRSVSWCASSALRTARAQLAAGDTVRAKQSLQGADQILSLSGNPRTVVRLDRRLKTLRDRRFSAERRAA